MISDHNKKKELKYISNDTYLHTHMEEGREINWVLTKKQQVDLELAKFFRQIVFSLPVCRWKSIEIIRILLLLFVFVFSCVASKQSINKSGCVCIEIRVLQWKSRYTRADHLVAVKSWIFNFGRSRSHSPLNVHVSRERSLSRILCKYEHTQQNLSRYLSASVEKWIWNLWRVPVGLGVACCFIDCLT